MHAGRNTSSTDASTGRVQGRGCVSNRRCSHILSLISHICFRCNICRDVGVSNLHDIEFQLAHIHTTQHNTHGYSHKIDSDSYCNSSLTRLGWKQWGLNVRRHRTPCNLQLETRVWTLALQKGAVSKKCVCVTHQQTICWILRTMA